MLAFDACVLIAFLDSADVHHAKAHSIVLQSVGHERWASPVTLTEVLVAPARAGQTAKAEEALRALSISQVPMGSDTPRRLAVLRAETGLKLPDCCVLLAAQDAAADTIATVDHRLERAARALGFKVLS